MIEFDLAQIWLPGAERWLAPEVAPEAPAEPPERQPSTVGLLPTGSPSESDAEGAVVSSPSRHPPTAS